MKNTLGVNTTSHFPTFLGILTIIISCQLFTILSSLGIPQSVNSFIVVLIAGQINALLTLFICLYAFSVANELSISENVRNFLLPVINFKRDILKFGIVCVPILLAFQICIIGVGFSILHINSLLGLNDLLPSPQPSAASLPWWFFIFPMIIAPIIEEVLYRGIILQGFLTRYSPVRAIIFSSLLFGIWHLSIPQMIIGTILGIFLSWIFIRTKSLTIAIICHSIANALLVGNITPKIIEIFSGINITTVTPATIPIFPLWFIGGSLCFSVLGILFLHRTLPKLS